MGSILGSNGHFEVVSQVSDGPSALEEIERLRPDALVLEIAIAGIDGLEVIQQMQRRGLQTKILVLAAEANGAIVYEAFQAGASGFVTKDAEATTIRTALAAILAGETYLPPNLAAEMTAELRLRSSNGVGTLTAREREVLALSAKGDSVQQIALKMALSVSTIKTHLEHAYRKLNVPSRPAAIAEAMRRGLLK